MKKIKKLTFSEMSKKQLDEKQLKTIKGCLLYTSPSPRDA